MSSRNAPSQRTALKKNRSLLNWIVLKTSNSSLRLRRIKPWLSASAKQPRISCSGPPAVYQDLSARKDSCSTRHDRSVKKAIIDEPIRMKGNSKLWIPGRLGLSIDSFLGR